jgi:putative endonuclease
MFFVYVLKSLKDESTYVGYSKDLETRLIQHNNGETKSIKSKIPFEIVYYEAYKTQRAAIEREKHLKKSRFEKEKLFQRIFFLESKNIDGKANLT